MFAKKMLIKIIFLTFLLNECVHGSDYSSNYELMEPGSTLVRYFVMMNSYAYKNGGHEIVCVSSCTRMSKCKLALFESKSNMCQFFDTLPSSASFTISPNNDKVLKKKSEIMS
jgi:hypothetical protein